jgi:hypothetical protein
MSPENPPYPHLYLDALCVWGNSSCQGYWGLISPAAPSAPFLDLND